MIYIKPEWVKSFCINKLEEEISSIGGEYAISIDSVDELNDYTIESIEVDAVYYALYSILPLILDDCLDFLDDVQDYWDPRREYYRNVFS